MLLIFKKMPILPILFYLFVSINAIRIREYDYIIVGAGTGGSVLLKRLSENPSIKILVLEAGEKPPLAADLPSISLGLISTKYAWNFTTVPSKRVANAVEGRWFELGAAKMLGGTAMMNLNIYSRGNRRDFDLLAFSGADGWDWANVFPYFLRHEDNRDPGIYNNGYHGRGGDMPIQFPPFFAPITKAYLEGAKATGYHLGDFNGPYQTVFMTPQSPNDMGRRWSSLHAFINPAKGRRNLHIKTSAFVTKILIDQQNRAYGVLFNHKGRQFKSLAKHEVIVSAGTFNSPKLLMLSGIGPKDTLFNLNIPIIADLPVGRNLKDHITTLALQFEIPSYSFADHRITKEDYEEALINGTGPLTSSAGIDVIGFVNSKYNDRFDWPDIEIFLMTASVSTKAGLAALARPNKKLQNIFKKFEHLDVFTCLPFVERARSEGFTTIRSKDPYDKPLIDLNQLSHPYDIKVLVEGLKYCLKLASTEPMKRFGVKPLPYIMPGCEKYEIFSDEYLECMVIAFPFSPHHFVGTCKMGHPKDPSTVVDATLKVKGIQNLRIVDASVIPTNIGCHPMSPVMMIAEKAADMILYDYERSIVQEY